MQTVSEASLIRFFPMDLGQVEKLCKELMAKGLGDASVAINCFTNGHGHVIACINRPPQHKQAQTSPTYRTF